MDKYKFRKIDSCSNYDYKIIENENGNFTLEDEFTTEDRTGTCYYKLFKNENNKYYWCLRHSSDGNINQCVMIKDSELEDILDYSYDEVEYFIQRSIN